ncbi:MAG: NAD(P)-dependent dehydrogenase (short-subunit alcohol dehydrogenase family) [Paracoccaceae bacterium]
MESAKLAICPRNQSHQYILRGQGSGSCDQQAGRQVDGVYQLVCWFQQRRHAGMGAYAAFKAGLIALVQSLACDHAAKGIRNNTILPGGTKTAVAGDDPATHDFIAGLHSLKRMAEPKEIALAALFLLSDRSSFVTGFPMAVDSGMSVRLL